jgi:hypothetical protein
MAEPTDEQLKAYAESLPSIYRDTLAAFPGASPRRRVGEGLLGDTIEEWVLEQSEEHRSDDVFEGLLKLVEKKFLIRESKIAFVPTPLGEKLIEAIVGRGPVMYELPELPVPMWA